MRWKSVAPSGLDWGGRLSISCVAPVGAALHTVTYGVVPVGTCCEGETPFRKLRCPFGTALHTVMHGDAPSGLNMPYSSEPDVNSVGLTQLVHEHTLQFRTTPTYINFYFRIAPAGLPEKCVWYADAVRKRGTPLGLGDGV